MAKKKQGLPLWRDEERELGGYEEIIYEKDVALGLGRIILNGPEKRNPLSYARKNEIGMALREMELDEEIKVIIIKGAGPSFCAGYDITPVNPGEPQRNGPASGAYVNPDRDRLWSANYQQVYRETYSVIFDLQKPVIAQIHGYCLAGGTHLAAFCDLRIVAENAQIGFPVSRNWNTDGYSAMSWLTGVTKAKYWLFTGQPMDGNEAFRCNWASAVFSPEKLEEETEKIASNIALVDTDLIMLTKRLINRQLELQGFKTGIMWGMDVLPLAGFRKSQQEGDEFRKISQEKGLKAALEWRDQSFNISYRTSEQAREARDR